LTFVTVPRHLTLEFAMVLCPVAIAVGCKKCPIVSVCPVKGIIGDYKKGDTATTTKSAGKAKGRAAAK
jgi:hypothetical protein